MSVFQAAAALAQAGCQLFPIEPRGKRPINTGGFLSATSDLNQLAEWFPDGTGNNLGLALDPSGLCVLDVDVGVGKDGIPKRGMESLQALVQEHGPLPHTLVARTGSGGLHLFFSVPPGTEINRRIGIRPGLDLLVNGYVIVAPSVTVGEYRWENPGTPIAPIPEWLVNLQAIRKESSEGPSVVGEGGRNSHLASLAGALRRKGTSEEVILAALIASNEKECNPPLPRDEVERIAKSVARYKPSADERGLGEFAEWVGEKKQAASEQVRVEMTEREDDLVSIAMVERPPVKSYPTGVEKFDQLTGGGLATRQLLTLVAPPGAGKSALAYNWARTMSPQIPFLIASTELESFEVVARCAAPVLDCPWTDIVRGKKSISLVREAVKDMRIHVIGAEELPRGEAALEVIFRRAEALAQKYGVAPIIEVDYLQDMARGVDEKGLRGKLGDIATTMRAGAQALDCAVIAVSSVSRAYYGAAKMDTLRLANDATVYLAAAKESGDVDYASATVCFLDLDRESGMARIAISKARHGTTGFVGMRFIGATGVWESCPEAEVLLAPEARARAKAEELAENHRGRIIDAIKQNAERGIKFESQKALKAAVGGNGAAVGEAFNQMLQDGTIGYVDESYIQQMPGMDGGRVKTRKVLVLLDAKIPSSDGSPGIPK